MHVVPFPVLALVALAACRTSGAMIEDPVESEIMVARDGARSLSARVAIVGGTLKVEAGPCPVMNATIRYDARAVEPRVEYWVDDDGRGRLDVSAPRHDGFAHWTLCMTDELPTELSISSTKGHALLALGDIRLDRLDATIRGGNATIDLVGRRYRNTTARLDVSGAEDRVQLIVPKTIGVRVTVTEGSAGPVHTALRREADAWINDAWGTTPVQLEITVELGPTTLEIGTR
jgi:hypothetical protein